MNEQHSRRQILQGMGAARATFLLERKISPAVPNLRVAGADAEIQVASVSAHTVRLTVLPIDEGKLADVATNGSLVRPSWGMPIIKVREEKGPARSTLQHPKASFSRRDEAPLCLLIFFSLQRANPE